MYQSELFGKSIRTRLRKNLIVYEQIIITVINKKHSRNPKHTTSIVKHGVRVWTRVAATVTGSLVLIDDITGDSSNILNSEYRVLCTETSYFDKFKQIVNASKHVGWHFILQQDRDPKHTAKFFKAKKCIRVTDGFGSNQSLSAKDRLD